MRRRGKSQRSWLCGAMARILLHLWHTLLLGKLVYRHDAHFHFHLLGGQGKGGSFLSGSSTIGEGAATTVTHLLDAISMLPS